jgi:hypothetical protein
VGGLGTGCGHGGCRNSGKGKGVRERCRPRIGRLLPQSRSAVRRIPTPQNRTLGSDTPRMRPASQSIPSACADHGTPRVIGYCIRCPPFYPRAPLKLGSRPRRSPSRFTSARARWAQSVAKAVQCFCGPHRRRRRLVGRDLQQVRVRRALSYVPNRTIDIGFLARAGRRVRKVPGSCPVGVLAGARCVLQSRLADQTCRRRRCCRTARDVQEDQCSRQCGGLT